MHFENTMRGTETVPQPNNSEKGRLRDTRLTKINEKFRFFCDFFTYLWGTFRRYRYS